MTAETVRVTCALAVRPEQRAYVAANALSIAQALPTAGLVPRRLHGFVETGELEGPEVVIQLDLERKPPAAG